MILVNEDRVQKRGLIHWFTYFITAINTFGNLISLQRLRIFSNVLSNNRVWSIYILSRIHSFPDPIQGSIELPLWLISIIEEPTIRRMLFIRQLGLKAYIDFPGAIHTRYSHSLGTMQLAHRLVSMLSKKMQDKGNKIIAANLRANENNLMAAGFLHDIGHGPFSHVLDFVMKKVYAKTHEELSEIFINQLPS